MSTREKQTILNIVIIISVLAIIVILAYIIYPEVVKNQTQESSNYLTENTTKPTTENITQSTETTQISESTEQTQNTETTQTTNEDSIGSEEKDSQEDDETKTKEEKAIELAKKEWGETDTDVEYNIEQKDGNIYYISVKKGTVVQVWYEVDTENWTISQY